MGSSKSLTNPATRIGRLVCSALVFGALAVACLLGGTAPAGAQGAVRSVHGDWQIRCDTPPARRTSNAP